MRDILNLIAQGELEQALLLFQQTPSTKPYVEDTKLNDSIAFLSRLNAIKTQYSQGGIEWKQYELVINQITFALTQACNKYFAGQTQPTESAPVSQPTTTMQENPLVAFDKLYRDGILADNAALNFNETNVRRYVGELNRLFGNTGIFDSMLDALNVASFKNGTNAEKITILSGLLEKLVNRQAKLREKLAATVQTANTEEEFQEIRAKFRQKPTGGLWRKLYDLLSTRFADATLYDPAVLAAWQAWDKKVAVYTDDLEWGLDFVGSQHETDLNAFLATNAPVKNFNV